MIHSSEHHGVWRPQPSAISAVVGEVHLWRLPLKPSAGEITRLWDSLSDDEQARADRYKIERIRRRFIAARGQLRAILSKYLATTPEQIEFRYQSLGKPYLAPPWSESSLQFNLSDSHEMALCGITVGNELGTDVERIRDVQNFNELARRYFAKSEIVQLERMELGNRLLGFFNCWTRKEAYLKAVGSGLSFPLNKLEVTVAPGQPARLLTLNGSRREALGWHMDAIVPVPGYVAALAINASIERLVCYSLEEPAAP